MKFSPWLLYTTNVYLSYPSEGGVPGNRGRTLGGVRGGVPLPESTGKKQSLNALWGLSFLTFCNEIRCYKCDVITGVIYVMATIVIVVDGTNI